jgi:hypothetical protein
MMKTQIGLGVLAIPTAFDTLGIVPGVICLCVVTCIITWSNYVIGTFKMNHREVYSIDDAGAMMFGGIGRGILSVAFCLCTLPKKEECKPFSLTTLRLDICCRLWYSRDINWLELHL